MRSLPAHPGDISRALTERSVVEPPDRHRWSIGSFVNRMRWNAFSLDVKARRRVIGWCLPGVEAIYEGLGDRPLLRPRRPRPVLPRGNAAAHCSHAPRTADGVSFWIRSQLARRSSPLVTTATRHAAQAGQGGKRYDRLARPLSRGRCHLNGLRIRKTTSCSGRRLG